MLFGYRQQFYIVIFLFVIFIPGVCIGQAHAFKTPDHIFDNVKSVLEHGETDNAIEMLKTITVSFPGTLWDSRASFLIGKIQFDRKNYDDAKRFLLRASTAPFNLNDYTRYFLGIIHFEENEYAKAVYHFTQIPGAYTGSIYCDDAMFYIAESYYRIGQFSTAATYYRNLVDRYTDSSYFDEAYYNLGLCLEDAHQRWEALKIYRKILMEFPHSDYYMQIRSRVKTLTGDPPEKVFNIDTEQNMKRVNDLLDNQKYTRALYILVNQMLPVSSGIKKSEVLAHIGICKFHLRNYTGAIESFNAAIESGRGDTSMLCHYYLARIYFRKDDEKKFFYHSNFLLVADTKPEFMDKVLYNLGSFYEKKQRFRTAIGYWRKLADGYPDSSLCDDGLWHLAWNTYLRKQYSSALEALQHLEEKIPDSEFIPRVLFWKGKIYESRKRYGDAYRSYHKLAHFFPYTYYGTIAATYMENLNENHSNQVNNIGPVGYLTDPDAQIDPALLKPENFDVVTRAPHYMKGRELVFLGLNNEAIEEFTAFETNSELDFAMQFRIADMYIATGNFYRGIRTLIKIVYDDRIYGKKIISEEITRKFFPYDYRDIIHQQALKKEMDPYLVTGMILQESAFNHRAVSSVGAKGLMQLMPSTAKWLIRKTNIISLSSGWSSRLFEPEINISLGTAYIKMLLDSFPGQDYLAIASYNAGKGNVEKWLKELKYFPRDEFIEFIPFSETQQFVKNVLRNREMFRKLRIFD